MNSGHLPKRRFLCPKARIIHADMKSTPRTQSVSQEKAVRVASAVPAQSLTGLLTKLHPILCRTSNFLCRSVVISALIWHSCHDRAAPDMPLSRNIVLLLCAGVVTITSIGMNSFSLFLRPIEAEFGWSRTTATVPYMFGMLGWGVGGVLFGKLADDMGARRVILLGILLMAAGFFGMGLSQNLWQLSLSYGVLVAV